MKPDSNQSRSGQTTTGQGTDHKHTPGQATPGKTMPGQGGASTNTNTPQNKSNLGGKQGGHQDDHNQSSK